MSKVKTVFLLLLLTLCANAQQAQKGTELRIVLAEIEKQHQVHFNYLDETITGVVIAAAPPNSFSLPQKLDYLMNHTPLLFEYTDAGSISISKAATDDMRVVEQLQEVLIPQYLTTGIAKKYDGSFTISPKKFGLLPGLTEADVLQTMQQLPGVISADETISNINVRGGTHDQNLFLWNGVRMFQTGHFFGLISVFNPSLPQQIDIYKNGTSAFFGESVSSTVDITTHSDSPANATAIGANLINAEFYASLHPSPSAAITISGRRSFTDIAKTPTYGRYADRIFQNTVVTDLESSETVKYDVDKEFYFYDFSLQYHQLVGQRSEVTLSVIAISNELEVLQQRRDPDTIRSRKSDLAQQDYGGSIKWKTGWNIKNTTEISGYFSRYNLDAVNRSVQNEQTLQQQNEVLDMGFQLQNTHRLSDRLTLENGYQYNETGVSNHDRINTPLFSRRAKDVLRIHALILQARFEPSDKSFFLQPGLRINYLEKFAIFLLEPRLQSGYNLSGNLRLEALAEFKSQTASQVIDLQQDFLGLEKRRWILADNGDVPIQKSFQSSLGLTYSKNGWLLTAEGFYKKVKGISSRSQSFQNQLEFEKIQGDYTAIGGEFLAQKNFGRFRSWLSYAINSNEYTFPTYVPKEFSNNFEIVHSLGCAGIYESSRLKIALGAKWYTGKPQTTPLGKQTLLASSSVSYHDPNNASLDDYLQLNFSAAYQLPLSKKSRLVAGVSVMNLLNSNNIINRYYRVNDRNDAVERVNTYSLGRTPNVSLKLYF